LVDYLLEMTSLLRGLFIFRYTIDLSFLWIVSISYCDTWMLLSEVAFSYIPKEFPLRARCGRSMLWSRAARMCQVQSIRPVLILPKLDWRQSPP